MRTYRTSVQRAIERNRDFPHQVSVKRYKEKAMAGTMPLMQRFMTEFPNAQWWKSYRNVDGDWTQVFGFRTEVELTQFKEAYPT